MKLAEILAREMDVWPESTYCYTQDNDGNVCPWMEVPTFKSKGRWDGDLDMSYTALSYPAEISSDYDTGIVTKDMWLIEKNKLHEGVNTEWREGVDLPPVGSECVHAHPSSCEVVKILAHTEILGKDVAVYQVGEMVGRGGAEMFRKLDRKDQERENYIDRIYGVMCKAVRNRNSSDMAEALYDAGLRFVEE